jgi:hypothetical protein
VKRLIFLLAIAFCSAASAEAQSDSVLTRALMDTTSLLGRLTDDSTRVVPEKIEVGPVRLATSSAGFVFGALLGGFAGHEIRQERCRGSCQTRIGESLLTGAAIGGTAGAALGAAFLHLRSVCPFEGRLLRTVIGSGLGGSAMYVLAGGRERRKGTSAFFVPIGAVGGALASLGRCWQTRQLF